MAAPKSSLTGRLQKLEAAQARADKLKRGTRLSAKPMAELLGVTWTSLKDWCDEIAKLESSGAVVRGGNGVEWSFEPRQTIRILIDHFQRLERRQKTRTQKFASAVKVELPDDETPEITEIRLHQEIGRNNRKEMVEQAQLSSTEANERLHKTFAERIPLRIMSIVTKADPFGKWPPAYRAALERSCREACGELFDDGVDIFEEYRATIQQKRTL